MDWWAMVKAWVDRLANRFGRSSATVNAGAEPNTPRIFTRDAVVARRPDLTVVPRARSEKPQYYLAATLIAKDEGKYIEEWLDFHFSVGVEHVYFFDNFSTDDTREKLGPYITSGKVTYQTWNRSQVECYKHAIITYGHKARWMAFIDADEFIFPATANTLKDVLVELEDYPVILVSWLQFGFGGHAKRPEGWVTRNFTRRAAVPSNPQVLELLGGLPMAKCKSIVDPLAVETVDVHIFKPANNRKHRDSSGREVAAETVEPSDSDKILLNHYYTKSEEEFMEKIMKWHELTKYLDYPNRKKNEKENEKKKIRSRAIEIDNIEDLRIARFARRAMITKATD